MITRLVKLEFSESFVENFKWLFTQVNTKISSFEGCVGVDLLQHETDKNVFFTISKWQNADALENYRQSDLFKHTWAQVKPHFVKKAEAWSLLDTM
ncbi:putative quinol monooxygenase [Pedobacter nanyangensis]|uniref:putative quinol monooxygenase n=1 Tax=Pedobacter nanyangensis TaxID=1562389 RepID=UPI000DE47E90|nr:antibiotic biosynthesis monooxygenase [Pedobacter nanyangensis]